MQHNWVYCKVNMKLFSLFRRLNEYALVWFGSRWFWRLGVMLFAVQSIYIALVGRFSMAFDEYYHLGVIQAYAKTWLPWRVQQPPGPATLGAVPSDGSYLYHYLMSFPYRLLAHITSSEIAQVIVLRLIDVGIVIVGLYVFRRLLARLGMPRWATQFVLVFITLLPVTPFLAGQLTYDTLFFTMTGLTMLVSLQLVRDISRRHTLPLATTALTLALLMLSSQVKYAFLPIALATGLFLVIATGYELRQGRLKFGAIKQAWQASVWRRSSLLALGLLVLAALTFSLRYGSNMVRYHAPVPECGAVLSVDQCRAYDPYGRNQFYKDEGYNDAITRKNLLTYPFGWFNQMVRELYFAVGPMELNYPTGNPLPVSYVVGYGLAIASGLVVAVGTLRILRAGPEARLVYIVLWSYVIMLFAQNLHDYRDTGVPVAIHGRYILQLLPLVGYLAYESLKPWLRRATNSQRRAVGLVLVVLLVLTFYGGGIAPFVLRSSDEWYWSYAVPLSRVTRSILWPLVLR